MLPADVATVLTPRCAAPVRARAVEDLRELLSPSIA
jgi:hypothetical protein